MTRSLLLYLEVIDTGIDCTRPYDSKAFTGEVTMTSAHRLQHVREIFCHPVSLRAHTTRDKKAPRSRKRGVSIGSQQMFNLALESSATPPPPGETKKATLIHSLSLAGPPKASGAQHLQESVFGEAWTERRRRIKRTSPFGDIPGWRLVSVIVKANDDLRQEQFAMQLIKTFKEIWEAANLPLQLRTYEILAITSNTGIMETIIDAVSISTLKKRLGAGLTLQNFYDQVVGWGSTDLMLIQKNFVETVAATSLLCYFLQVKDRHNANILIDRTGRVIHVDYGWILDNTMPINLESAPFKLTQEMTEVMGGANSPLFQRYRKLCVQGFLEARSRYERIALLLEAMESAGLQCIQPTTVSSVRQRFQLHLSQKDCETYIQGLIDASLNSWSTGVYDAFQKYYANIY